MQKLHAYCKTRKVIKPKNTHPKTHLARGKINAVAPKNEAFNISRS
jgi:hypothetical protein